MLDGENKYLYPYKNTADFKFDTFHMFEPGVLKPFALKALEASIDTVTEPYAAVVYSALKKINAIPFEAVPQNSLICEFIPGGIYESLY